MPNVTKKQVYKKSNTNKRVKRPKNKLQKHLLRETSAENEAGKKPVGKRRWIQQRISINNEKRVIVIEGDAPLYMIQLAAFRNAKRAEEMAEILSQKHKSRLKDVDLETMTGG